MNRQAPLSSDPTAAAQMLALQTGNYARAVKAGLKHDLQEANAIAVNAVKLLEMVKALHKADS